ncbi:EamA family transporter [bacterium]|nr:EamA family transporter [bacterium]
MNRNSTRGIWLMIATVFTFAMQDGFSRHLAETYNTLMVVMIRYWVFAAFVLILALRQPQTLAAIRSRRLHWHMLRAVLLVGEICVVVYAYTLIGLIQSLAIFTVCPLFVVAMSGPILGERLSLKRWLAVGFGCIGVLVLLRPGASGFGWPMLLPVASAFMFALYSVLTRLTTRDEPFFAAFFWPPIIGAGLMTVIGLPHWQAISPRDWIYMACYAAISVLSNWLLQKTYQAAEASVVQPFAYLQIVFISGIGIVIYGEALNTQMILGTVLVVLAGLYALTQARQEASA